MAAAFYAAGCTATSTSTAGALAPSSAPRPSSGWVDSVMAAMSPRDRAAQLVWPQLFGDYAPANSAGWTRITQLIGQEHVGGLIMSIGSPIETAEKLNA